MAILRSTLRPLNDLLTSAFDVRIIRVGSRSHDGYHREHRQEALAGLRRLEESTGRRLSPRLQALADDYAVEVFGGKEYAPWLYVYSLVSGDFKEGWMPDNFFGLRVMPAVNKGLRGVTDFKTFSNVVLKTSALPDIACYLDGILYNRDFVPIDVRGLRDMVAQTSAHVFLKKDGSNQGRGLIKLPASAINEDVFKKIGNCVIQPAIAQHEAFEQIISGSLATVRITTVKNLDGSIDLRASYLRLGRSGTAWVQANNSVRVAVVDRSGQLDCFGYTEDWFRWTEHPDTNVAFADRRIPRFDDAVELCVALHRQVPHITIIGWDVAISRDEEVVLLEWNGDHPGIKVSEAITGPCFVGLNWERFKAS